MAQITLVYRISVGNQVPSQLLARAQAIVLQHELEILFMTKVSDVTIVSPPGLVRTVVLQTSAETDNQYPTDELKKAATRNLWTAVLQLQLPGSVTADEPVVV